MKEQVIQASNPLSEPCQRGNSRDISGINKTLLQLSQDKIALICRHIGTETQEGDWMKIKTKRKQTGND